MAVYCRSCGGSMAEEVRFCGVCGAAVPVQPGFQAPAYARVPYRPMIRARAGRLIAGVCQGIANQHGWDPAWVRVIMVLSAVFLGGAGGIAYLVLWIAVPEEPLGMESGGLYAPPSPFAPPAPPTYPPLRGN